MRSTKVTSHPKHSKIKNSYLKRNKKRFLGVSITNLTEFLVELIPNFSGFFFYLINRLISLNEE